MLIGLGMAAWVPYAVLRYGLDAPVEPGLFLAAHLAGVIPGSLLVRWDWLRARWQSLQAHGATEAPLAVVARTPRRLSGRTRR